MATRAKKKPKYLSVEKLVQRTDELLRFDELSMDQQHQLMATKRYLTLEDRAESKVGQAALSCAEMLIDHVKLEVYQRRFGMHEN